MENNKPVLTCKTLTQLKNEYGISVETLKKCYEKYLI